MFFCGKNIRKYFFLKKNIFLQIYTQISILQIFSYNYQKAIMSEIKAS